MDMYAGENMCPNVREMYCVKHACFARSLQRPQDPASESLAVSTNPPSSVVASSLPSLTTILQTYIPTLQHVPKGARDCWSRALSDCLLSVANNPADLTYWCKLFMLFMQVCLG